MILISFTSISISPVGIFLFLVLINTIFEVEIITSDKDIKNLLLEELAINGISKYKFVKSYEEVEKILQVQSKISSDKVKKMHLKMWMFTHGIACLIATNTCDFTDDEISMLLTEEFQALMNDLCHKDS